MWQSTHLTHDRSLQICKRKKPEKNLMIFKVKNLHPVQTYQQERKVKHSQILSSIDHKNMWDKHDCNFKIFNLSETLKFMNFVTWWIIIPSTPDLFHVVCNIKVVITSQDSYASPSSKIIGFAVNNFGFLGIPQKTQIKTTSSVSYTQLNSSTRSDNKWFYEVAVYLRRPHAKTT